MNRDWNSLKRRYDKVEEMTRKVGERLSRRFDYLVGHYGLESEIPDSSKVKSAEDFLVSVVESDLTGNLQILRELFREEDRYYRELAEEDERLESERGDLISKLWPRGRADERGVIFPPDWANYSSLSLSSS